MYGVNRLFYLRVRCKITVAVFLTLRWYLSVNCETLPAVLLCFMAASTRSSILKNQN
jgi:hypothetical protein